MKKLLFLAFILSLIISCDKEETDPYKDFWGFHVKDTTGLKLFQAKQVEDVNYLVGLRDKKLWIGKFDNDTKEQLGEWNSPEVFNTSRTIDLGYGEIKEYKFDLHSASLQIATLDEQGVAILAQIGQGEELLSDLHVASGDNIQSYIMETPDFLVRNYSLVTWNNGYAITFNYNITRNSEELHFFYSMEDKTLFKTSGYIDLLSCTPLNQEEVIAYNQVKKISRINFRTGETIWETDITLNDIPSDAKLSPQITPKENNFWTYIIDITFYSGEKDTRQFKIDIDNGEITYL